MNISQLEFMQNQLRQMEAQILIDLHVLRAAPAYRQDIYAINKLSLMRNSFVSLIEHTVELIEEAAK